MCVMKKTILLPHLLMGFYALLVAGSFHVGHRITMYMPPLVLTFVRFMLATLLFGCYVGLRYGLHPPSWRDMLRYLVISATLVGYFWALFASLRHTSALNTSMIYTLTPLYSTLFGLFFLGEKPSAGRVGWLVLAMLGALWVIAGGSSDRLLALSLNPWDFVFMAGCALMGLFSPLSKKLSRGEPTAVMTFRTLAAGSFLLFLLSWKELGSTDFTHWPPPLVWGLLYLVVCTTILTFFIVQYASLRMEVGKVMGYVYLTPVFALAIGLMLGHSFSMNVLPGVLVATLCTFFLQRS
jgi:drug/metabolite transporter (DMT)-like permease